MWSEGGGKEKGERLVWKLIRWLSPEEKAGEEEAWRCARILCASRKWERFSATRCPRTGALQLNLVGITLRNLVRQLTRILVSLMVFLLAPFSFYKRDYRKYRIIYIYFFFFAKKKKGKAKCYLILFNLNLFILSILWLANTLRESQSDGASNHSRWWKLSWKSKALLLSFSRFEHCVT